MVAVQDSRPAEGAQNPLRPAAGHWRNTQQSVAKRGAAADGSSWGKGDAVCVVEVAHGREKLGLWWCSRSGTLDT